MDGEAVYITEMRNAYISIVKHKENIPRRRPRLMGEGVIKMDLKFIFVKMGSSGMLL
jgi:hypothetical protein